MNSTTLKSIIGILLASVVGVGVAWAGGQGSETVLGIPIFWLAVGGAYLIQWLVFILAFILKTEKFYDLTGSLTYITLTTASVLLIPQIDKRAALILVLVVVWATRLGTFLFNRVHAADSLYGQIRQRDIR